MVIISSGKEGQGLGPSSAFIPLTSREGASVQKKLEKHFPPEGNEVNKITLGYLVGGGYGTSIPLRCFSFGHVLSMVARHVSIFRHFSSRRHGWDLVQVCLFRSCHKQIPSREGRDFQKMVCDRIVIIFIINRLILHNFLHKPSMDFIVPLVNERNSQIGKNVIILLIFNE